LLKIKVVELQRIFEQEVHRTKTMRICSSRGKIFVKGHLSVEVGAMLSVFFFIISRKNARTRFLEGSGFF